MAILLYAAIGSLVPSVEYQHHTVHSENDNMFWKYLQNNLFNIGMLKQRALRHGKNTTLLHEQGLSQNYFTRNRCVNYNKSDFATKQRKMYLTKTMRKKTVI